MLIKIEINNKMTQIEKRKANCKNYCKIAIIFILLRKITRLVACPSGPTTQIVSVKKTKHLEVSDSIWILGGLSQKLLARKKNKHIIN